MPSEQVTQSLETRSFENQLVPVIGIDVVSIRRIESSLANFGNRFIKRLFSEGEAAYARQSPTRMAERLAARFAAKEATIKAFELAHAGVGWRDIEVVRLPSGACRLSLHGQAAALVAAQGVGPIALSISHDGDCAMAAVTALRRAVTP